MRPDGIGCNSKVGARRARRPTIRGDPLSDNEDADLGGADTSADARGNGGGVRPGKVTRATGNTARRKTALWLGLPTHTRRTDDGGGAEE